MMGHKICLFGEIWKIISKLYLLLHLIWSSGDGQGSVRHAILYRQICLVMTRCYSLNNSNVIR